ncbi:MAG: acetylornithine deacetylase/succinyl-diaminopimelate desuccinylase family protein [Polyangiaceae bacterium]|nr:acetylornithine deacetylase/succinyl-diaminopimelate desuccinylase family protein [Polyangiaceae bacterium]MCE7891039.1 acetylornithine deacetylase/succinyl-diaminopimelate desuccinylase family protein [Sorangiineae bacterium PRO1]MCL4752840.1 acetylornithine deacetylase/succinyl-diaminopimelate desuccinylase family protein [Myxococcales bacterium]
MNPELCARLLEEAERAQDELVALTQALVRIPSVNPPGEHYRDAAELLGADLAERGYQVAYHEAEGSRSHSRAHPRVNVLARLGDGAHPVVHLNGHLDVVPASAGWTVDPFAGLVTDGKLYGRGTADMKAGLAAGVLAVEVARRAGLALRGSVEISGTVDEESGGQAGVAWLCEKGVIRRDRVDHVIIPEPLDPDRICVGHRGVYWFKVTAHGRVAHGSMPFLGSSAIDHLAHFVERVRTELQPALRERVTHMPVVPDMARHATLNVNAILGGQAGCEPQTPCVADHAEAIFDRRFLLEEGFVAAKEEIVALLAKARAEDPSRRYTLEDLLVFHPVQTPAGSPLVAALERAIEQVYSRPAQLVASPGTYDHKHFARLAGIEHCVAYGPGTLELAHQPDEHVAIEDLVRATGVMALALVDLGVFAA